MANDKEIATQQLSADNNWQYTFTNLERNKDGQEIRYNLTEDVVPGYSTELSGDNTTGYQNIFVNTKLKTNPLPSGNAVTVGNPAETSHFDQKIAKKKEEKAETSSVLGVSRDKETKKEEAKGNEDDKENKDAKGEVLGAERNTKTGDYSRNLQYLFFFAASGFGLFAFFYKEKKRKVN
jgi:collagen-binding A protein family protein (fragment)